MGCGELNQFIGNSRVQREAGFLPGSLHQYCSTFWIRRDRTTELNHLSPFNPAAVAL